MASITAAIVYRLLRVIGNRRTGAAFIPTAMQASSCRNYKEVGFAGFAQGVLRDLRLFRLRSVGAASGVVAGEAAIRSRREEFESLPATGHAE
jgi:hypothetical protein